MKILTAHCDEVGRAYLLTPIGNDNSGQLWQWVNGEQHFCVRPLTKDRCLNYVRVNSNNGWQITEHETVRDAFLFMAEKSITVAAMPNRKINVIE